MMKATDYSFCDFLEKRDDKKVAKIFTLVGAGAGFLIWVVFFVIEIISKRESISGIGIVDLHKQSPSWWLIDTLPITIGIATYAIGTLHAAYIRNKKQRALSEQEQNWRLFRFAERLNQGDFDASVEFEQGSELGQSMLQLREYLRKSRQDEQVRAEEEKQRRWVADGLAKFGDILRLHNDNMGELSYELLSNLVRYLHANQGGFFLLEDADPADRHFTQTAAFAYERRRLVRQRVEWGDGLIGMCAFEKEPIFMTDIPDSYVSITSGLGGAAPHCLLMVPLVADGEVQGVIELASFSVLTKFEVDFVVSLSEAIASTIKNVKITSHTAALLKQSQHQAERLQQQEEEMLHTIEELHSIQEESVRKGVELANFTESVNNTLVRAEYDISGNLLFANERFLANLGYTNLDEIRGKHISFFINKRDRNWFFDIWDGLTKGGHHFEGDMKHVTKQATDFWSMATYTCVRDQHGVVHKILFMGIDITELKERSLDLESQVFALNNSAVTAEFDPVGTIRCSNKKFLSIIGYGQDELKAMTVYDLFPPGGGLAFRDAWAKVVKGTPQEDQYLLVSKRGKERWLHGTFTAVYNMYNELAKVVLIANDITSQKVLEMEAQQKTAQLLEQDEQLHQKLDEIKAVKIRNEKTLEGAMDAIITIGSDERVEFYNRAAEELFGYSRSEVIGQHVGMLLPSQCQELELGDIIRYLKSDENRFKGVRTEVIAYDKAGSEIALLLTVSEAQIGEDYTYTAFIQNISVELF
jgi:PAS domain S-box-containing protein